MGFHRGLLSAFLACQQAQLTRVYGITTQVAKDDSLLSQTRIAGSEQLVAPFLMSFSQGPSPDGQLQHVPIIIETCGSTLNP